MFLKYLFIFVKNNSIMDIKLYTNEQLIEAARNQDFLDAYRKACRDELQSRVNFKVIIDDLY